MTTRRTMDAAPDSLGLRIKIGASVAGFWFVAILFWFLALLIAETDARDIGQLPQPDQQMWVRFATWVPAVPWICALATGIGTALGMKRPLAGIATASVALGATSFLLVLLMVPKPA